MLNEQQSSPILQVVPDVPLNLYEELLAELNDAVNAIETSISTYAAQLEKHTDRLSDAYSILVDLDVEVQSQIEQQERFDDSLEELAHAVTELERMESRIAALEADRPSPSALSIAIHSVSLLAIGIGGAMCVWSSSIVKDVVHVPLQPLALAGLGAIGLEVTNRLEARK